MRDKPLFIPEWTQANARERAIKPVLSSLEADYVIRRPLRLRDMKCAADVFIEHPSRGWLILAVDDIEYEELVQTSMLYSEEREKFEQRLANLQSLLGSEGSSNMPRPRIYALLVMSKCKSGQVKTIVNHYLQRFGVALLSLEEFNKLGSALIARYARLLNAIQMESVRTRYFPETEIAPALTTRRFLNRGQAASLPKFYLDADQEWASKLDLEMPEEQDGIAKDVGVRLVNGIAGSGKTLIAINRALMLAKIYPDQEILFLIHNAPVVDDTNVRLHRTLGSIPKNLVIETFFGWVFRQWWGVYKKQVVMMKVPALERFVDDLKRSKPNSSLQTRQILDEIDFIHQTMIPDEATYLDVERIGRGSALQKTQRREMWQYYQALNNELSKRGEQTWSSLPTVLSCDEKAIAKIKRFEHIIVDEAQFFAPSWFELVKQALAINGRLFMCADPNQGFLKTRLSWKKVGLDVTRGRTKWLRHSYRTTRAILQAAHRLLPEVNGSDKEDYLQPDFDGMREGSKPTLIYVDSHPDAVTRLIREIKAQNSGQNALPLSAMLVLCGDKIKNRKSVWERLRSSLGDQQVWWFKLSKQPPGGYEEDYLRMAYLDTATGLEAAVVFLIGMEDILLGHRPLNLTDDEWRAEQEEARRKLYMAMTRAGQHLVLISADKLPDGIAASFELYSV